MRSLPRAGRCRAGPQHPTHHAPPRRAARCARAAASAAAGGGAPAFPGATAAWRAASARSMARFMVPAAGVPLCDPLLTLVDVLVVGRCCGTLALAALGPNAQLFSFVGYLLTGVNAAVIGGVADALRGGDEAGAGALASAGLAVAAAVGAAATLTLLAAGPALVSLTGAAPALAAPALSYLRVRALACPLTLATGVAQATLLAARDARTPLAWVGVQAAANVALDLVLVAGLGLGLPGAAAATVASQAVGTLGLLLALQGRGPASPSLRGLRSALDPPRGAASPASTLATTGGPVTAVYFAKVAAYWLIQSGANGLSPVAAVAAHQPVWQAWSLASFAHTPLEAAALSFVPAARSGDEKRATIGVLLRVAAVVGAVTALAASLAALHPSLFTPDPALHALMRGVAPQAFMATAACAADVAASGALIALGRPRALVRTMLAAAAAVGAARWWAVACGADSLGAVWWALTVFFVTRAAGSLGALAAAWGDT